MFLPVGEGELRFMGVASHIMPVTVHVKSLNSPEAFSVIEQNYEYDLMNANKLLDKYVGKNIKIMIWKDIRMMEYMEEAAAPQFKEKPFFEYHICDLQRKTTIKDNQTKQISLLEATGANVHKELIVYGSQDYFTRHYRERNSKQTVNVYVKFMNTVDNNFGTPIPEGIMRLYKMDSDAILQFIGEDRVGHTPVDEEIRLTGNAFDVVAEREQTDYKQITKGLSMIKQSAYVIFLPTLNV